MPVGRLLLCSQGNALPEVDHFLHSLLPDRLTELGDGIVVQIRFTQDKPRQTFVHVAAQIALQRAKFSIFCVMRVTLCSA